MNDLLTSCSEWVGAPLPGGCEPWGEGDQGGEGLHRSWRAAADSGTTSYAASRNWQWILTSRHGIGNGIDASAVREGASGTVSLRLRNRAGRNWPPSGAFQDGDRLPGSSPMIPDDRSALSRRGPLPQLALLRPPGTLAPPHHACPPGDRPRSSWAGPAPSIAPSPSRGRLFPWGRASDHEPRAVAPDPRPRRPPLSRCHPNRQGGGGRDARGPVRDAEGCNGPRIGVVIVSFPRHEAR